VLHDDESFYRRRLSQEEEAIRRATTTAGRLRHEELAGAYRFRLRMAPAGDLSPPTFRFHVESSPQGASSTSSATDEQRTVQYVPNPIVPAG